MVFVSCVQQQWQRPQSYTSSTLKIIDNFYFRNKNETKNIPEKDVKVH